MLIVALIAVSLALFVSRLGLVMWVRETNHKIQALPQKIRDEWNWEVPGKIETSAEWFRELRPDNNDWHVRSGSYGLVAA